MIKNNNAIIIDYKFGEIEEHAHILQVKKYIEYLDGMGFTSIEGYVWYISLDKIVKVNNNGIMDGWMHG